MRRMPVRDAARELGCSKDALYRMIQAGKVEVIVLPNGRMVVEQTEIDRVVEQGRTRRKPDTVWEPPASRQSTVRSGYLSELEAMLGGKQ